MAYSTISKPALHFNTVLYTGDGATSTAGTLARTISGVGFQPDFTWVKGRTSGTYDSHGLHDAVRTAPKWMRSDNTDQEYDVRTGFGSGGVGSFTSDGFGIFSGTSGNSNNYNTNNTTYVAWNWLANGAGSSNSDGSITSTVSANTTAGFSIVTYTGNGQAASFGHGLSTPDIVLIKDRTNGGNEWYFHTTQIDGSEDYLSLQSTAAKNDASAGYSIGASVFNLGGAGGWVNLSGDNYLAYCFKSIKGYSKFGSYTGNGNADGPFIYTGFKPAFLLLKKSSASGSNWVIFDNKRDPHNKVDNYLIPNLNIIEGTSDDTDFLSNGFKLRSTGGGTNASNDTYIYMAFAEEPLVANVGQGIPATAR